MANTAFSTKPGSKWDAKPRSTLLQSFLEYCILMNLNKFFLLSFPEAVSDQSSQPELQLADSLRSFRIRCPGPGPVCSGLRDLSASWSDVHLLVDAAGTEVRSEVLVGQCSWWTFLQFSSLRWWGQAKATSSCSLLVRDHLWSNSFFAQFDQDPFSVVKSTIQAV